MPKNQRPSKSKKKTDETSVVLEFRDPQPDDELWDSGALGESAEHAVSAAPHLNDAVDRALGLQLISIRLQGTLLSDLKKIAHEEGLTYQPLIRQILTNYVRKRTRARK